MIVNATYYTADGRVTCNKRIQDTMLAENAAPGEQWIVTDATVRHSDVYVEDGTLVAKTESPITVSSLSIDTVTDCLISGIPAGTLVRHPDGTDIVNDGALDWGCAVPGEYLLTFESIQHFKKEITIEVTA